MHTLGENKYEKWVKGIVWFNGYDKFFILTYLKNNF